MKKSIGKVTACCLAAVMTGAFGLIGVGAPRRTRRSRTYRWM